jgi:hypothetical protein
VLFVYIHLYNLVALKTAVLFGLEMDHHLASK